MRRELEEEFGKVMENRSNEEIEAILSKGFQSKNLKVQDEYVIDCDNYQDLENQIHE